MRQAEVPYSCPWLQASLPTPDPLDINSSSLPRPALPTPLPTHWTPNSPLHALCLSLSLSLLLHWPLYPDHLRLPGTRVASVLRLGLSVLSGTISGRRQTFYDSLSFPTADMGSLWSWWTLWAGAALLWGESDRNPICVLVLVWGFCLPGTAPSMCAPSASPPPSVPPKPHAS